MIILKLGANGTWSDSKFLKLTQNYSGLERVFYKNQ